jgi:cell wall-associated NlpC family hydrolase
MSIGAVTARMAEISQRFAIFAPTPVVRAAATAASADIDFAGASEDGGFASILAGAQSGAPGLSSGGLSAGLAGGALGTSGVSRVAGVRAAEGRTGAAVVAAARDHLGVPYVWGGTNPATGLDCSGLTQQVYRELGITLPRVSSAQAKTGTAVPTLAAARPGDLLFFDNSRSRAGIDHVAIYAGGNRMIEAPRPGLSVREVAVPGTPVAIRRILPETTSTPTRSGGATVVQNTGATGSYAAMFRNAEQANGLPTGLLAAVAKVESNFKPTAVSSAGARGLMQLMPATARSLGVDPMNPAQAIDGAARLLAGHLRTFGSLPLALAAYNAGPGAVTRSGGIPPYAETRAYVAKVQTLLEGPRA